MNDDDLSEVLRNISRESLAGHPATREFLEAGIRVLEKSFFAGSAAHESRAFRLMSRGKVVKEAGGKATLAMFTDRWPCFSGYLADLILYALRPRALSDRIRLVEQAVDAVRSSRFSRIAHEVAFRHTLLLARATSSRLLWLFAAFADDPVMKSALSSAYNYLGEMWASVYIEFLRVHDMRLRPGLTVHDLALLIGAVADGLVLRCAAVGETSVVDCDRRVSLLGTAVLALGAACVDSGDGRTIEQMADRLFGP